LLVPLAADATAKNQFVYKYWRLSKECVTVDGPIANRPQDTILSHEHRRLR
jgi:hypothetical protein